MDFKIPLIKQKITYFLSTKEMSLWHYSKYLETLDLKYFSNYYDLKNPKEPTESIMQNSIAVIYGELLEISENHKVVERFNNTHRIYKLETKYLDVTRLIKALRMHEPQMDINLFKELIMCLEKWHYKIDRNKDVFTQIDKIEKRVQGIKSEIESLKILLKKDTNKENADIDEIIYYVERGLDVKYQINKRETSLHKWALMQKELKRKIDLQNRQK